MAAAAFLLLVTWIAMTGASSYQVEFADRDKCETAATALLKEQDRLRDELKQQLAGEKQSGQPGQPLDMMKAMMAGSMQSMMQMAQPSVSAICIER